MARLLFHSPAVRPDPAAPTGPALAAALVLEALAISRHEVTEAARFRPVARAGDDHARLARLEAAADCQAGRLLRRYDGAAARPDVWLSCTPRALAADRLGARAAAGLGLPAMLVATGPGGGAADQGPKPAAAVAVGQAALDETAGLGAVGIRPFVDLAGIHAAKKTREQTRAALAARLQLPADEPWLIGVLTGAEGAADSLADLSLALSRVSGLAWRLLVVPAAAPAGGVPAVGVPAVGVPAIDPRRLLSAMPHDRARLTGPADRAGLLQLLGAADIFAWPRVGEAEALALLQAQACGLAAVTGRSPWAGDIVVDGRTGRLAEAGNPASFANQLTFLLRHPNFAATYQKAAAETALADHGLAKAADALDAAIEGALGGGQRA